MVRSLAEGGRYRDHRHDRRRCTSRTWRRAPTPTHPAIRSTRRRPRPTTCSPAAGSPRGAAERRRIGSARSSPAARSRAPARPSSGRPAWVRWRCRSSVSRIPAPRTRSSPSSGPGPRTTRPRHSPGRPRSPARSARPCTRPQPRPTANGWCSSPMWPPTGPPPRSPRACSRAASARLDPAMSWSAADGTAAPALPPVHAGLGAVRHARAVTRYDVEVFPTFDTLAPGHRLRVTHRHGRLPPRAAGREPAAEPDRRGVRAGAFGGGRLERRAAADRRRIRHAPSAPTPPAHTSLGCPAATGRLRGQMLGRLRLGMTRAAAQPGVGPQLDPRPSDDGLLLPVGGRRPGGLLRGADRADPDGQPPVRPPRGPPRRRVAAAARRLRLRPVVSIGSNRWYATRAGAVRGVLETRHGVVEEIGIADGRRLRTRAAAARFLRSFELTALQDAMPLAPAGADVRGRGARRSRRSPARPGAAPAPRPSACRPTGG